MPKSIELPDGHTVFDIRDWMSVYNVYAVQITQTEIKAISFDDKAKNEELSEARQNTQAMIMNLFHFAEAFQKLVASDDVSDELLKAASLEFGNALDTAKAMGILRPANKAMQANY